MAFIGDGSQLTNLDAGDIASGTLTEARGGTGESTYTDGQLLIGSTPTGGLTKATLTAGSGITVTNAAGAITIAASGAGGFSGSAGYNSPGNFTAPPTTNKVYVYAIGGGGGAGGYHNGYSTFGGGGGSGGIAFGVVSVTAGSTYSITVGSGGNAGPNTNSGPGRGGTGNAGGASSFSNLISANGGNAGTGWSPNGGGGSAGTAGTATAPTGAGIPGQDGNPSFDLYTPPENPKSALGGVTITNVGKGGTGGIPAGAGTSGLVFVAY